LLLLNVAFTNTFAVASVAKFIRPNAPRGGVISERDLDIIEALSLFGFSPSTAGAREPHGRAARRRKIRILVSRIQFVWHHCLSFCAYPYRREQ